MRLVVVGLGRMGGALACALVASGADVAGFDLSEEARGRAASAGVDVAMSLAAAVADADVVITSLPTSASVREVVDELAGLMPAGSMLLETSTCSPSFATYASALLAPGGITFLDCPVSGKPPVMTMLVGAAPGGLGEVEQVVGAAVSTLIPLGRLGAGYEVKLLQQYVKYARFLVGAEALAFAQAQGLDVAQTARALMSGTGGRPGLATAEEHFLGDAAAVASHAPTSTIVKDVELTRVMFQHAGFSSPTFSALAEFFLSAADHGMTDRPYPEVVDLLPGFRFSKVEPQ
jgi:3-hydroxyisobutyrate dehydrogenase-like beta-hydroxyacid dehydrogenase